MTTTVKWNNNGRFRGRLVAVVMAITIAVVVVGLPPQGQSSRRHGAPGKEEEDDRDEQG